MTAGTQENQLELFDITPEAVRPRPHGALGWLSLHLRYDQCVIVGIAGVIGLTVVFACGVERGKQLARGERALLARQERGFPRSSETTSSGSPSTASAPESAERSAVKNEASSAPPAMVPKGKEPVRRAAARSRYAVQVVTFSRPQLAKQELDRLKAKGEPAFLVIRDGRTSVYVGPFPSKGHAAQKVGMLKPRYQDCFVKTL